MPLPRKTVLRAAALAVVLGAAAFAVWYIPPAGYMTNDVTTGQHSGYPDLQPRRYDLDIAATTLYASEAARRLRGWVVKRTVPGEGVVQAEVGVPALLPVFTDDVTVTITSDGDLSRVVIRSHSRLGRGDLGENARHIRALQRAMDERLPPAG